MGSRTYIAIDLKSFYASVECTERGLDPMTTNLVVADESRTTKTICLAVSPALKAYGISGRARLFEVVEKVGKINALRQQRAPNGVFTGASYDDAVLKVSPALSLDYIIAPPRMEQYITHSTRIYNIYLKYVAPEDIHVYSIDEVFIDATDYLKTNGCTARAFAKMIILDVLHTTGITATAGISENLYLCKVAMDIVAKHIPADQNGVRIAELDEKTYRRTLWSHRPLTDFWRVGRGYARKLEKVGLYTMGDIARCSIGKPGDYHNEDLLYNLFGIHAELLIDHAWGWESCTIADIKAYQPSTHSMGSGQVLQCPYPFDKAKLVVREMTDLLVLDLVDKRVVSDQLVLTVGYDIENLRDPELRKKYQADAVRDRYGRTIPKHAHGTVNLGGYTSSAKQIMTAVSDLFDRIVDRRFSIRRLNVTFNHVVDETAAPKASAFEQLNLFTDYAQIQEKQMHEAERLAREKRRQAAVLSIKKKFGKNSIFKGMDLEQGATARDRNQQIGGHKA